jgi:hypothetical protein
MRRMTGWVAILLVAGSTSCFSHTHTREVVVERQIPVPAGCAQSVWVPSTHEVPGHWQCSL